MGLVPRSAVLVLYVVVLVAVGNTKITVAVSERQTKISIFVLVETVVTGGRATGCSPKPVRWTVSVAKTVWFSSVR